MRSESLGSAHHVSECGRGILDASLPAPSASETLEEEGVAEKEET